MKIFGHASGGWLASRFITGTMKLTKLERRKFLLLGTIAGTLPDWDYFWYAYKKGGLEYSSDFRHHTWVTHTFPFYWVITGLIYIIGVFLKNKKIKNSATIIAASTTTHLVQDMVGTGDGIMLYYPFSKKMTGIGLLNVHGDEWNEVYTKSPYYLVELIIGALAILSFLYDVIRKKI